MSKPIDYRLLPVHLRDGMRRYIEQHIETGSFLRAVLENNFTDAASAADYDSSQHQMVDISLFLIHEAPPEAWGSRAKVGAWLAQRKAAG